MCSVCTNLGTLSVSLCVLLLADFMNYCDWVSESDEFISFSCTVQCGTFMPIIKFYCRHNQIIGCSFTIPAGHNFDCLQSHSMWQHTKNQKNAIFIVQKNENHKHCCNRSNNTAGGHFNDWPKDIASIYFYAIATIDIFLWYMCRADADTRIIDWKFFPGCYLLSQTNQLSNHSYKVYFHVSNTALTNDVHLNTNLFFPSEMWGRKRGWRRTGI